MHEPHDGVLCLTLSEELRDMSVPTIEIPIVARELKRMDAGMKDIFPIVFVLKSYGDEAERKRENEDAVREPNKKKRPCSVCSSRQDSIGRVHTEECRCSSIYEASHSFLPSTFTVVTCRSATWISPIIDRSIFSCPVGLLPSLSLSLSIIR